MDSRPLVESALISEAVSEELSTIAPSPGRFYAGRFTALPGWRTLRPHGTRDWQWMWIVGGRARIVHEDGAIRPSAGSVVLFRPGTLHDYSADEEAGVWDYYWAHFVPLPHWHEHLKWPEVAPGLATWVISDEGLRRHIEGRFAWLCEELARDRPLSQALAMNGFEELILRCAEQNPTAERMKWDLRIRKVVEFIEENLAEPLRVEDLARQASLSPSRFAHLFRAELGASPQRFVELERIRRARHLLEHTTSSVQEVADRTGFENSFYFATRFKRFTGESPTAYRDRHRRSRGA